MCLHSGREGMRDPWSNITTQETPRSGGRVCDVQRVGSTFKPETKLPDFISSAVKCSFLSPWDPLNLAHDSFPKLAARNALSIRRESSLINAPSPGFYPPAYSTDCKWASGSRGEVMDAVAMPTEHLLITVPQKAPSPSSRPSDVAGSGKDR